MHFMIIFISFFLSINFLIWPTVRQTRLAIQFMRRLLTVSRVALQMRLRSTGPRATMYTILVGLVSMANSPGRQTKMGAEREREKESNRSKCKAIDRRRCCPRCWDMAG